MAILIRADTIVEAIHEVRDYLLQLSETHRHAADSATRSSDRRLSLAQATLLASLASSLDEAVIMPKNH